MSIECGICERDLRGGHAADCPRRLGHVRRGWAVAIKRDDGSEFLACAGIGILPAVWPNSQRRFAVAHKRELIDAQGFRARVVPVTFADPQLA